LRKFPFEVWPLTPVVWKSWLAYRQTPLALRKSASAYQQPSFADRKSSLAYQQTPFAVWKSSLAVWKSPFAVWKSSLAVWNEVFPDFLLQVKLRKTGLFATLPAKMVKKRQFGSRRPGRNGGLGQTGVFKR
jgi:hypothetical protein